MSNAQLHFSGNSWLHRIAAGPKFFGLLLLVTGVLLSTPVELIGVEFLATVVLYPLAQVPLKLLWHQVRTLLPFLVLIFGFQLFASSWQRASVIIGQLVISVVLAGLITATTKLSEMLELWEKLARPLNRFGISSWRIALVLALTMRCIPMVARAWHVAGDAYRARGMRRHSWRMVVPVIVYLLRSADTLGDAITARGVDDQTK